MFLKMKKLLMVLFFISIMSLWWCSHKTENSTHTSTTQTNKVNQANTENWEEQQVVQKRNSNTERLNTSNQVNNIKKTAIKQVSTQEIVKDKAKLNKINHLISSVWWYKVNCKTQFKTQQWQYDCQMNQLMEAGNGCTDPDFPKSARENPDNYFTKKRFDLLDENSIQRYKQICQNSVEQEKQSEVEFKKEQEEAKIRNEKLKAEQKKLEEKIKNFKLSDCKNLAEKQSGDKQDFIKKCEIWFVLNYKDWNCSLLTQYGLDKECKRIKKELELYKRMQRDNSKYWSFNLDFLLAPKQAGPAWFGPAGGLAWF